jgi:putative spermidine/putrescine transport system ATP-binding protein
MSFLSIRGLGKRFGNFVAVDRLDLEVERGEFLSLLGPSGCGKTTTLQMVAGFIEPSNGTVSVGGRDITSLRPEKRGMGVVFQSYALFPHMTVEQNIAFGLEMRGMSQQEIRTRVGDTIALVQLDGLGHRYPRELSGGQRQRVAIARALAIRPEVLLLDEPMSNLDAKLREEMHIEMRAIQRHLDITTVLVTHDQVEAMTMSDRIAVMYGGRIVQLDTPYNAYEHPASDFASTFLGKTNKLLASSVPPASPDKGLVKVGNLTLETAPYALDGDVHAYIRPEKIRVREAGQPGMAGRVKTKLFLGSHWMLEVETPLGLLRVNATNQEPLTVSEGDTVSLSWNSHDLQVLPTSEAAHA